MEYYKTATETAFGVQNLVTAHHIEMRGKSFGGEWHSFPELIYVHKGVHRVIVDGELFEAQAGQVLIYAPHAYHCGRADLPPSEAVVEIISFETDFKELSQICNRVLTPEPHTCELIKRLGALGRCVLQRIPKGEPYKGMKPREDITSMELHRIKNMTELLLMDLYEVRERVTTPVAANRRNQRAELLLSVQNFLRTQLDRTLTQEEIAAGCHISVSKLKALCHAQLGCGPIALFISLKIGEAKRLIADSELNFTEIAERLGFTSIHYFSKLFKEKTGLTPSEYARTLQ